MTRISSFALSAALLAHAGQASAECTGVISTFPGTCDYASFVANLNDACNVTELFPEGPEAAIAELCEYDAITQFVEIQGTYQKDRRYFAGGGSLVDGADYSVESASVSRFETNIGSGTIIGFPEYYPRIAYNAANDLGTNGYPANMNLEVGCDLNTVMCCFTDGNFADNGDSTVDVCRHDLYHSPQSNHITDGWSLTAGSETSTHCVGFTWAEADEGSDLLGNMMYDISLRNTILKGYKSGVPGAPMCGCVESMPTVESAECRTASSGPVTYTFTYKDGYVSASNTADVTYSDCGDLKTAALAKGNDLSAKLVGDGGCESSNADYLNEEEFLKAEPDLEATRYRDPDLASWSQIVGEGSIHFLPPHGTKNVHTSEVYWEKMNAGDADFRAMIDAGCWDLDGDGNKVYRKCMVRRMCPSCTSEDHQDIYYKRLTDLPPAGRNATAGEVNFLYLFMERWNKYPANSMADGDFELYSDYADAVAGTNKWAFCNYDNDNWKGIGFPRDCAPIRAVGNQWNSYYKYGHGSANQHGFYVEIPKA